MKNLLVIALMLVGSLTFAQNERTLKLNEETNLIDAVYVNEAGDVVQTGSYTLDGKLQGEWISYDAEGKKTVSGKYDNGVKTGKWFFWSENTLKEVDYAQNNIANVNTWVNNTIADSRRP